MKRERRNSPVEAIALRVVRAGKIKNTSSSCINCTSFSTAREENLSRRRKRREILEENQAKMASRFNSETQLVDTANRVGFRRRFVDELKPSRNELATEVSTSGAR